MFNLIKSPSIIYTNNKLLSRHNVLQSLKGKTVWSLQQMLSDYFGSYFLIPNQLEIPAWEVVISLTWNERRTYSMDHFVGWMIEHYVVWTRGRGGEGSYKEGGIMGMTGDTGVSGWGLFSSASSKSIFSCSSRIMVDSSSCWVNSQRLITGIQWWQFLYTRKRLTL